MSEKKSTMWSSIFEEVTDHLKELGVELEGLGDDLSDSKIKVVCVPSGLSESVKEMGRSIRDKVVMVRLDEDSSDALDDWVEAGAVKSRSEAAALFIREGLKVRQSDLSKLQDALRDVDEAKERLRSQARDILGDDKESDSKEGDDPTPPSSRTPRSSS